MANHQSSRACANNANTMDQLLPPSPFPKVLRRRDDTDRARHRKEAFPRPTSEKRRFGSLPSTSGLPPGTDIEPILGIVPCPAHGGARDHRNIGTTTACGRSGKSQTIANSHLLAGVKARRRRRPRLWRRPQTRHSKLPNHSKILSL